MMKNMKQMKKERQENKNNEIYDEKKTNINWYPGHMAKTKREIKEIISTIDIVVEIIDSRIPISSHIEDLSEVIGDKKLLVVFNKYDLCDKEKTNKFIKFYNDKNCEVVTCDSKNSNDYKKIVNYINNYMIKANDKRKEKGLLGRKATVLMVGVPNTGKSTLINKIIGKNVVETGNKPGVTKNLNKVKINEYFNLIDSPGILWPKFKSEENALNLGSMTTIKESIISSHKLALHILNKLSRNYPYILKESFGIDEFNEENTELLYEEISKYKKIPLYRGEVDYEKISELIANMIKKEQIKGITFDNLDEF